MTRNTLTEWPTGIWGDAVEWWMYYAAPDYVGIPGRFRYDDHGHIVFECEDGTALGAGTFEDGERFEPCEAPNPDPRDARIAAPLRLPSVDEVSVRVHEAWMEGKRRAGVTSRKLEDGEELMVPFGDLSEQAKELDRATVRAVYAAIGAAGKPEPALLRLGRGPTDEEFRRHNTTGGGWLLQGVGEDMGGWTMEMRPIPEADIPAMVRFTRDAIPLNASRQPCGVGVKV